MGAARIPREPGPVLRPRTPVTGEPARPDPKGERQESASRPAGLSRGGRAEIGGPPPRLMPLLPLSRLTRGEGRGRVEGQDPAEGRAWPCGDEDTT
ncbi:hypothetical protein NDU88_004415 [Pleurodeles waltl]|uniref:Uncharacterized protein n=1 Tax=Pleurodeles waltl TaxID=8319 RepID=A0AAV7SIT0_PLEWA|nr:hypothetical protein NDU88_004415 [Pleurodeles waltl]